MQSMQHILRITGGLLLSSAAAAQTGPDPLAEARSLLGRGEPARAEALARAHVEKTPDSAAGWSLLGSSLHVQGKLEEALAAHLRAAEGPKLRASALYNAGCASALLGRADEAFEHLQAAREAGFVDRGLLASDADLESLRGDPRFDALFPQMRRGSEAFLEKPAVLWEIEGEAMNDEFGWVARRVGDLDGDGVLDFVTSAPGKTIGGVPHSGRVYACSGRSGKTLWTRDGRPGERFGNGVGRCGDVDADGTPDVVVGAPSGGGKPGRALVLSGKDGSTLHEWSGEEAGDQFGIKVSGAGDLDGDGAADLVVGAMGADVPVTNGKDAGRCFFYSGASGELLFTLEGESAGDNFGSALDASMDDHIMVAIGAMNAGPGKRGRVLIYRASADGAELLFAIEAGEKGQNLGQYFVSFPGDLDGDGVPDVYASDFTSAVQGNHSGRVVVASGKTGEILLELHGAAGDGFGTSPSQADDVDGDGVPDLIVGAWQHASGAPSGGRCTLHSGKDGSILATFTCIQPRDTFGFDAQGLGDTDGDGHVDFLLTSGWAEGKGPKTGRVFLISGEDL